MTCYGCMIASLLTGGQGVHNTGNRLSVKSSLDTWGATVAGAIDKRLDAKAT